MVPSPGRALDRQPAAALLGEPFGHRQPEAGALVLRLGGEERLQRALQCRLVHAGPGVRDGQADILAGLQTRRVNLRRADSSAAAARVSVPPRHGVAGIGGEVYQHRLQLAPIGHHGGSPRCHSTAGRSGSEGLRQDFTQAGEQVRGVDPLGPQIAAAGEREQPAGNGGAPLSRAGMVRASRLTLAGVAARASISPRRPARPGACY